MTTTFQLLDYHQGATATFNPSSLSANGTVTMTVSDWRLFNQEITVGITGSNGTEVETRFKQLKFILYLSTNSFNFSCKWTK